MQAGGSAYSYTELVRAWKALNGKEGICIAEIPCMGASRPLLFAEFGAPGKPVISFTAGMHGNEPVTPWALFTIVRDGLLHPGFAYRMWPCVNPSGYIAGCRHNAGGDDINRSFHHGGVTPEARTIMNAYRAQQFALQIDLHEDCEAEGFYCYEPSSQPDGFHGPDVIGKLLDQGFPVQDLDAAFDVGYAAHTLCLEQGRVLYDCVESAETMSGLPLNVYLFCRRAAHRVTTFETPASLQWNDRITMHRLAVTSAIAHAAARTLAA